MTHPVLIERITRSLAYMLRHQPEKFDVEVDAFGWADLDEVVQALDERLGESLSQEDLSDAVQSGDRVRYELNEGRIRALYGHSIAIEPGEPDQPPEDLYLAVPARDVDRAQRYGLRGGRRRFVHLALSEDDAREAGRRTAREYTLLRILSKDAWEEGINFYDRKSLFLAEEVPTQFLEVGETYDDGEPPEPRDGRRRDEDRGRARGPRGGRGGRGRRDDQRRSSGEGGRSDDEPARDEDRPVRADRDEGRSGDGRRRSRSDRGGDSRTDRERGGGEDRRPSPREDRQPSPREDRQPSPREDRAREPVAASGGEESPGASAAKPPGDFGAGLSGARQAEVAPAPEPEPEAAPAPEPEAAAAAEPTIEEAPAVEFEAEPEAEPEVAAVAEPTFEEAPAVEPEAEPEPSQGGGGPGFGAGL